MDNDQEKFELGATKLSFAHACSAGAGWKWWSEGFELFKKNPGLWVLLLLMTIVVGGICGEIPKFGEMLSTLVSPIMLGGIMMVAHRCYMASDAEFNDLFSGFRYRFWPLIQVALLYLAGLLATIIMALVIMLALVGVEAMQNLGVLITQMSDTANPVVFMKDTLGTIDPMVMIKYTLMAAIIPILLLPIMMLYYFAPVLVMFHEVDALRAMKLSFMACWKNAIPFLIYGLLLMLFSILCVFTLFLGLLVLVPVIWASTYVAYRDIFLNEEQELTV